MTVLEVLQKRVSVGRLQAPAPDQKMCEEFILAATRAADHGNLTPWRFLLIQGEALVKLGQVFLDAAKADKPDMSKDEADRYLGLPLRAPLIITVIAKTQLHPKVPVQEQLYSAAAAAQNILNAAYSAGFGAVWRTGDLASHVKVNQQLGLVEGEHIIGFLYLGTPVHPLGEAKPKTVTDFLTYWN